jgi:hypothetical protein
MAKKSTKTNGKTRQTNALHEKILKLLTRPEGATMHDTYNAGYHYPAVFALKIAATRGYKTSIIKPKVKGELTRYVAKRAAGA